MQRKLLGIMNVDFNITGQLLTIYSAFVKYLLTPWCRVLLEKLTGLQLVKKFPAFHGTRRFITALTSIRHLSLSWASPIQSIYPHPTSWISILILSTHLRLGLPSGSFLQFPQQDPIHPPLLSIHATCPAHLILLDFITRTILGYAISSIPPLPRRVRQILEKKWEYKEATHQFFIDFKKAYDSVRRETLYNILIEFGIPTKLVRLIIMCLKRITESGWARICPTCFLL